MKGMNFHMRNVIYLIAVSVVLAAAAPASANLGLDTKHSVTLRVGKERVSWQSRQMFERSDQIAVWVMVGSRGLDSVGDGCVSYFSGKGIAVRVSNCGDDAPLRVSATNLTDSQKPIRFRFVYQKQ